MKVRLPKLHRTPFGKYIKKPNDLIKFWLNSHPHYASVRERTIPHTLIGRWK